MKTANLSDAGFKILVIRMLTEMVRYGHKIEEEVKAMQSEIKKNIQGTNSEEKETGTQINYFEWKGEINIQPGQNEETRIQINENVQGSNSDRKETGTHINGLDQKEEINIQPEQKEETRIQKSEERLRNLWENFTHTNIWIIGTPTKLKTYLKKYWKKTFLIWWRK